jgi:hypothetical protein
MSDYLMKCLWRGVADVEQQQDAANRIDELEAENHLLKTSSIIEVAVRNPSVMEYMQHWEGRAEAAEAKLAKAVKALVQMVGKKYYADDPWGIARATLAEIKGGKDAESNL